MADVLSYIPLAVNGCACALQDIGTTNLIVQHALLSYGTGLKFDEHERSASQSCLRLWYKFTFKDVM